MTKSFVKTTKRNCLTSMSKPVAETAVQNLAIAFERYNDQHPHSLVKYCSPANSGAERHHQFKYGSVSGDTGKIHFIGQSLRMRLIFIAHFKNAALICSATHA